MLHQCSTLVISPLYVAELVLPDLVVYHDLQPDNQLFDASSANST